MTSRCKRYLLVPILLLLASVGIASAQEGPAGDWRFGIVEAYEAPEQATALGASWTRITFNWGRIQAGGPQTWTPKVDEAQIEVELAAGREVMGLLIGMPAWAQDEHGIPQGLAAADDDPANLWATFVRSVVSRYRGRIDHWVIWNEPDIWDPETPGHTWDGSVADFARLQQVAYRVAKETNPDAVIHLAALTYFWDFNYGREQYFERLLEALVGAPEAARYHAFFDVATAHLYFNPSYVYDIIGVFREAMAAHGLDKPLWLVETNAPPSNDPAAPAAAVTLSVTLDEQAAFLPQAVAAALAAGADRVAVYKLKDVATDVVANPEPFGLLRDDGSRRPAFTTYQQAIRYLAGVRAARRERWDAVGQFWLDQGPVTTTLLFARLPAAQEATVPATAPEALLVDMWGTQRRISAADGVFTVTLPPALCTQPIGDYCMIGGTVYYLVQTADGTPLPAQIPLGAAAPTSPPPPAVVPPTATATATATATGTTTATVTATPTANATATGTPTAMPTTAATMPAPAAVTAGQDGGGASGMSLVLAIAGGAITLAIIAFYRRRRQA